MRVAMYYNNNDVRLEEIPVPDIASGEILIKVMAAGICGSDVLEWYRIKTAPRVLGHEITGEVVRVGEGVSKYKAGDRIFATHHVPCNTCKYCLSGHHTACDTLHKTSFDPGGFSEYLRVPSINVDRGLQRLPDEMSYEEGTFIEPLGCVLRGQRFAGISAGLTVLVLGSGITGLLHIQAAKAQGATRVLATDINDYRLNAAKRFGADQTIKANDDVPLRTKEFNRGDLADVVIVCAGAVSAIRQALDSVDRGGTVLLFAVPPIGVEFPIDFSFLWRKEIKLQTTYAAAPQDLKIALDLLDKKKVDVQSMITHRLPLEETGKGFKIIADAKESIKVIIEPQK